ncbi:MAG: cell surface protein [archaeon]
MAKELQKYLDKATSVLEKFGMMPKEEDSPLVALLQEVVTVEEPKVLAIAKTVKYESTFNELVRENVKDMRIADRYRPISGLFDSIREDSKNLVMQLEDGKIDTKEKLQNVWMKLTRGTPHNRFSKIMNLYKQVSEDTKKQLENENTIMNAYMDFRFALKDAEILSHEVLKTQETNLKKSESSFKDSIGKVDGYKGEDAAEKGRLQLTRDEAERVFDQEDRKYQLIKDVAESLQSGYNVGETLVAKLKQTHEIKDRVYRKSVAFFATNEHVFTTMDAVYTSQHGLNEATQTLEKMKEGANKGLEDIAELGTKLEKAALTAGYGSTYNPQSVQKLVDAIVLYQVESKEAIKQLRDESEKSAKEIETIVEDGKQRYRQAVYKFSK